MKTLFAALSIALLAGCVAVPAYVPTVSNQTPPYPQVPGGTVQQPPVVYVQPAPGYYYPAPAYYPYYWGPPAVNFGFRFGGGRHHRR